MKHLLFAAVAFLFAPIAAAERLAITFDDLPLNGTLPPGTHPIEIVERTLKILNEHDAPPVFGFVNGQRLEGNPDGAAALQLWVRGLQRVGNHTYSHISLNTSSVEDYQRDISRNEPVLMLLSPDREWRWFRYPYLREGNALEKRHAVRSFLELNRYQVAQTTIDYEDYLWNSPYARCLERRDVKGIRQLRETYVEAAIAAIDASRAMAQQVFGRDIDHVLLLHLGAFTPDILPALLGVLTERGFELATLEAVQADAAYRSDPQYLGNRGVTLLQQHVIAKDADAEPWLALPRAELEGVCR